MAKLVHITSTEEESASLQRVKDSKSTTLIQRQDTSELSSSSLNFSISYLISSTEALVAFNIFNNHTNLI